MIILKKISEMQQASLSHKAQGRTVAIVPTMGYLHEGHASLIRQARDYAQIVVVTLFVNPTQFGPNEDFGKYPRDFERDRKIVEDCDTDYLFAPDIPEMYSLGYQTAVNVNQVSASFEGEERPNHFTGVATIVSKLFNATLPDFALFGQKDYQQTLVIKRLVTDLNFPVKIIIAPTVRDADGLAMSSRNSYLTPEDRSKAGIVFLALEEGRKAIDRGTRDRKVINAIMLKTLRSVQEIKIDYASAANADTLEQPAEFLPGERIVLLIAAFMGKTRLIDNIMTSIPRNEGERKFIDGVEVIR